jgi:hypothetical protein
MTRESRRMREHAAKLRTLAQSMLEDAEALERVAGRERGE